MPLRCGAYLVFDIYPLMAMDIRGRDLHFVVVDDGLNTWCSCVQQAGHGCDEDEWAHKNAGVEVDPVDHGPHAAAAMREAWSATTATLAVVHVVVVFTLLFGMKIALCCQGHVLISRALWSDSSLRRRIEFPSQSLLPPSTPVICSFFIINGGDCHDCV